MNPVAEGSKGAPAPQGPVCDGAGLAAELKAFARSIGVARLGVTTAEPFDALAWLLRARRAAGLVSPFEEPDAGYRCDPARWLPGARSLISVAVSYRVEAPFATPPARTSRVAPADRPVRDPVFDRPGRRVTRPAPKVGRPLRGWISRHAWGRDYHAVVAGKLARIEAWLAERVPGAQSRAFVDTGPAVDRAVAERAGVGWIGRNCALIVPGAGSMVVLGTLVTTVELPPDPPSPPPGTECGDCDLCLRACPTGALIGPHELDPHRCLSYVTQMPGQVPAAFRQAMGNRLYGCDTCQEVCPKNRDLVEMGEPGFVPASPWETHPDLVGLLSLSKREFRELYARRASGWRGRKTLQRNALIALGNLGPEAAGAVDRIARLLLDDVRPEIRGAAAWALGRIGGEEAVKALRQALTGETDREVRDEIEAALAAVSQT